MAKSKERISLFTKQEFQGVEYAQHAYDKECKIFNYKLICAGISLISFICILLSDAVGDNDFLSNLFGVMWIIGVAAAIISAPISVFKTIWKIGVIGYWIVPFVFWDMLGFVFAIALAVMGLVFCPTAYCILGLIQSHINKKDAREYLELFNADVATE